MKKFTLFIALILGISAAKAGVVTSTVAQTAATNFYTQTYSLPSASLSLAYTEKDVNGTPVFYVFNVSPDKGFVIVSAEDAGMPVIGYSNKGSFTEPAAGSNFDYWMSARKNEIISMRSSHLAASAQITQTWNAYINNTPLQSGQNKRTMGSFPSNSYYLCQTTWDQPSPYNAMCPGGSVTGCVATAMSQIMRYWSYPSHGIGQSSYSDMQPNFSENYGTLTADYDTSNYVWSGMPLNVTGPNAEVAKLLYDAGVSVQMDYSPSGSGAYVITSDAKKYFADSACAQRSYVKYFGYNAATIQGILENNYNLATWQNMIETELDNNRPVQYVGTDPNNGGHTWVCDGYDANNNFHMNWGWSGQDNGWFSAGNLNPGGFNFSQSHEALIGIEPPSVVAMFSANPLVGCSAPTTVSFTDQSLVPSLSAPITSWQWTFTGGSPSSSNLQNPTVTYNSSGVYNVTLTVTNKLGANTVTKNNYIYINSPTNPPLSEGFESGGVPPAGWALGNDPNLLTSWMLTTGVGGFGKSSHCMSFDNCTAGALGEYDQIYTPSYNFGAVAKPEIYFDVAYAPYNNTYSDTLAVYYSVDCGATWTKIYLKGGMSLCTTGKSVYNGANTTGQGCFLPLSNNWRTDTIKIAALAGKNNVLFSFENRSGNGSTMYIDNINIPGEPLGVYNPATTNNSLTVYPNPSNGNFQVKFNTEQDVTYDVSIYNVLGQQVMHTVVQNNSGTYTLPINLSKSGKGVYSVVLKSGGLGQTVKKVAVF